MIEFPIRKSGALNRAMFVYQMNKEKKSISSKMKAQQKMAVLDAAYEMLEAEGYTRYD